MKRIETTITMPPGASPISAYTRYYSWADASRRKVAAVYDLGGKQTRIWLSPEKMIMIMDGGCGVITFTFDMLTGKPDSVACNGDA